MTAGNVERFVERAESFCRFIEGARSRGMPELLRGAQRELLALYGAAIELPAGTPDQDHQTPDRVAPPDWPGLGQLDFYWLVFDPYELGDEDRPVGASLSADLLEVYAELRAGLEMVRAGGDASLPSAVWEWRNGFRVHWGNHAISALRALHHALQR